MFDDQLTPLPDSFLAIWTGARQRLLKPAAEVRQRYDLCEDLANHLQASAQALLHDDGLTEDDVLQRIVLGLSQEGSGLTPDEGVWVARRLAELLNWPADGLVNPPAPA